MQEMIDKLLAAIHADKPGSFATPHMRKWLAIAIQRVRNPPIIDEVINIIGRAVMAEEPVGVTEDLLLLVSVMRRVNSGEAPLAQAASMHLNEHIARELVREMELDNGCKFEATMGQMAQLATYVAFMANEGCEWHTDDIHEMACGEESAVELRFWQYESFEKCSAALNDIFDGPVLARKRVQ